MSVETLAAYLLLAMQSMYSEANHAMYEPADVTEARYEAFAHDVAFAVSQPYVNPLFKGEGGRAKTGLVIVSIAAYESRYKEDVITCKVGGDHGHSWSALQIQVRKSRVCESVLGSLQVGLDMIWESFNICRGLKLPDRLAEYTDGNSWLTEKAAKRSELRMNQAIHYWDKNPYTEPVDLEVATRE